MMRKVAAFIMVLTMFFGMTKAQKVQNIPSFGNVHHPQIAYWFFNKDMLNEQAWKSKIDSLAANSKYTLIFLTARNGVDFFDPEKMQPIFTQLVAYAHSKGLQIGLQLWGTPKNTTEANCERTVVENEAVLDANGQCTIYSKAKHVRAQSGKPFKSTLLKAYMFKKMGNGWYQPESLTDITSLCTVANATDSSVTLHIRQEAAKQGYTVYALTQHYYKVSSNHSQEAVDKFVQVMQAYQNIPFDGIGLDEYTNLKLFAIWELKKAKETLQERLYSLDMAKKYQQLYHCDIEKALFDMRYAPINQPAIKTRAINTYMDVMRKGTLQVEAAVYDNAKRIFGAKTFVGLHDSHHNHLDGDEVWQTGINWWNVKRDYGHTDEETPTPTQMGIAYGYPKNMLYNMYYEKRIDKIEEKAYTDLLYNIRTHYHAINDVQNWGVSVEQPYALNKINRVENCARLLNHFNPALPEIKLLVVFGREALQNWYPDSSQKGICDVNNQLKIEEKAVQIWKAGYLNALVPTDVIDDNRLVVDANGKAVYNGHVFDAIVFLYPEYAKETTLQFLEKYVAKGGKLMVEGKAASHFLGQNIAERWNKISSKAVTTSFDIAALPLLGIEKNNWGHSCKMLDGSWLFAHYENFEQQRLTTFSKTIDGTTFGGRYIGYAALKATNGQLTRFAATSLQELSINQKIVLQLSQPADVLIEKKSSIYQIIMAGTEEVKVLINTLNAQ